MLKFTKANQLCREEVNASTRLFSSSPRKVWTFTSFKLKDRKSFPFLTKRCSCLIVSLLWSASSFCMAGKRCYAIKLPTGVDELNISCNLSCTWIIYIIASFFKQFCTFVNYSIALPIQFSNTLCLDTSQILSCWLHFLLRNESFRVLRVSLVDRSSYRLF